MKPNDLSELKQITALLKAGTATRRDMIALLILIRGSLSSTNTPTLLDISHCIAHPKRNQGEAHSHIEAQLNEFIDAAKRGGELRVNILFPIKKVVEELSIGLTNAGVEMAEEKSLLSQTDQIEQLLKSVLSGVEIKINSPHVAVCSFQEGTSNQGELFSFVTYFTGLEKAGKLHIPANVGIAFPVFKN